MKKYAVIVAGGTGSRMGSVLPKQFLLLNGKPVIWYTVQAFLRSYTDINIILVLPEQYLETGRKVALSTEDAFRIKIVAGGDTRFHSVRNGLREIMEEAVIWVHDAVRCLVTTKLIQRCYAATIEKGNAVPAVSATDSIRLQTAEGNRAIDRTDVKIIQTPQCFLSSIIRPAFEQSYQESFTDEASVAEATGVKINLVEGELSNLKITHPLDLIVAEKLLQEREIK